MKLAEILDLWDKDSKINFTPLEILEDAGNVHKLQAKYLRIYTSERQIKRALEREMKTLAFKKFEFYFEGPSSDTPKDWDFPARGKILKSDVPLYVDADKHILELQAKIDLATEKVEALAHILDSIKYRGNVLNGIMQHQRWTGGG